MFQSIEKARSPLEALSYNRFGGRTYLVSNYVGMAVTPSQIIRNNPNRVSWIMTNNDVNDVYIWLASYSPAFGFLLLMAAGGYIDTDWSEDGEIVGYEVWGMSASGTPKIQVYEVVRE